MLPNFCTNNDLFQCEESRKCISRRLVCNGINDCGKREDEKYCGGNLATAIQLTKPGLKALEEQKSSCRPEEFLCPELNVTKFIPKGFVCGGINNCGNKEYEGNCTELQYGTNY